MIQVLSPGPLTTIQDLGRPGHAALGVGRSGAADRAALRLANRLAGNDEGAAALELTFGGLGVRFDAPGVIVLAGAPCRARLTAAGATREDEEEGRRRSREVAMHAPERVEAGDELRVGPPSAGVRTYLAVAGGIDVEPVLGSRATDTFADLGPARLRAGDLLPVGAASGQPAAVDVAPVEPPPAEPVLRVRAGPREDWFTEEALSRLTDVAWTVTPSSDRVGLRLDGPPLERRREGELSPEGMVEGALQVPPDGRPVLFLADHPVTGGYPVIAVVAIEDVPLAAQARPGTTLRFYRG